MKTGLFIALALLCVVDVHAQQMPAPNAAQATVRIRANDLLRRTPNGTNTAVIAGAPQTPPPAAPMPPPLPVAAPGAPMPPAGPPAPVLMPPPPRPAEGVAAAANTNAVAATGPQTFQQNTLAGNEPIEFDWMNADIQQVLAKYGELTHRSAIMQQGITGMISFRSAGPLSVEEAIGALESVLLVNGYAIVPMGEKFFKVVPSPYGPQEGLPVYTEDAKTQQFDRLVAQVVRVKYLDPTDVARALGGGGATTPGAPTVPATAAAGGAGRVFMHPYGQIIPLPRSSALLLIDTALNVSRLKQIVEYMDTTSETKMETRVYVLENADAFTVSSILQQLIAADQGSAMPGQPGMPTSGYGASASAAASALGRSRPSVASIEESVIMGRVLTSFDPRTNAIILITQEVNFQFFEKIIKALDVKTNADFKTRVFFLNYADATDLANTLYQLMMGAEPTAVGGGRAGGMTGSPYSSRTGTTGSSRTTGLGGSSTGARNTAGGFGSSSRSSTASRTGTLGGSSASGRTGTTTGTRSTMPYGAGGTGATGTGMIPQMIEIIPDIRNNALVVFAPEQDMASLADVIKQLDVFPPQVAIDVVVAEVTLDNNTTFGINYFQKGMGKGGVAGGGVISGANGPTATTTLGQNANSNVTNSAPAQISSMINPSMLTSPEMLPAGLTGGLTYFARFFGDDLRAMITALSNDNKFRVLQTPHLYTSNNQTARIFAGESDPIVTSSQNSALGNVLNNYENVDIGVGLQVTPLISPDGVVTFYVYQTVDSVARYTQINGNNVPVLNRREAEAAAVTCKDGQIIIMGGLTTNSRQQQVDKVPVLGDIPVFGYLFKTTTWNDQKTELVFFLRPKIIRTIEEAQRYTWGYIEKNKDLRGMPLHDVQGYNPEQDKRYNEKLKAIDRLDKTDKF
jgi:general secretion pathway protein D